MPDEIISRSQMRRLAATSPDRLVEEIEGLRAKLEEFRRLYLKYRAEIVAGDEAWLFTQNELDALAGFVEE